MSEQTFKMNQVIPILRIFDEEKAKDFYIDFLEFNLDWEHRYEDNLPLYMQISKGDCVIHLSEHYGDCSPGAAIRIAVNRIEKFHEMLISKQYKFARPGIEGERKEVTVTDPFHNKMIFYEAKH